jgi:hypothetical protein
MIFANVSTILEGKLKCHSGRLWAYSQILDDYSKKIFGFGYRSLFGATTLSIMAFSKTINESLNSAQRHSA